MAAITVFFTFLLLLAILAAGAWGGYELHRRTSFLEAEYRRIRLASVEDTLSGISEIRLEFNNAWGHP